MTGPDKNTLQYMENTIASARPEDLTLMMYNGLMKFIGRAQEEIRAKSLEAAHNTLIRCQDIVFEFQYTLNMDYSLSNNLMLLYDYLYNRLIEANAKKDCDILDEVQEFVTELRDTWAEAIKLNKEQKAEVADAGGLTQTGAEDATAGNDLGEPAAPASPGMIEVAAQGASVRIGSDTPAVARTKAIYKRTGMPALAGLQAAAATAPGGAAHFSATAPPDTAAPSLTAAPPIAVKPDPHPIPDSTFKRVNPAAAAQYAKVSKAKTQPRESISLASE